MKHYFYSLSGSIALLLSIATPILALPGDRAANVVVWMETNPALTPASGDSLSVDRLVTPTQRFTFNASTNPPSLASLNAPNQVGLWRFGALGRKIIRSETFTVSDQINGILVGELEEELRSIYGVEVYHDYQRSRVDYAYPTSAMVQRRTSANLPIAGTVRGQLRLGQKFAYWWQVELGPEELIYHGKMTVFLLEDVPNIKRELQNL